jgi:ribonuclease P protein component
MHALVLPMTPQRLRSPADIRAVFAARRTAHGSAMIVYGLHRSDEGPPRAAVVAGRRVGPAVLRSRAKRRLRAGLADVWLPAGLDVVVVARPEAVHVDYGEMVQQLRTAVGRVGARAGVAP